MNEDVKSVGQIALGWWSAQIANRENPRARALAAKLRRAGAVECLSNPAVHDLAQKLQVGPAQAQRLARLVGLLAEIRETDAAPLARLLGGSEPVLSSLRFQRLMRAEEDEATALLRRAIGMADRKCNVAALAGDVWNWSDTTKARWCFQYFGADAPANDFKEKTE